MQERINPSDQADQQTRNREKVNIREKNTGNTTYLSILILNVNGLNAQI
jgi:hypothetical protein